MKSYYLNGRERLSSGMYSDLFVLEAGDFVANATTVITLTTLAPGDAVVGMYKMIERRTPVVGLATCAVAMGTAANANLLVSSVSVITGGNPQFMVGSAPLLVYDTATPIIATIVAGAGAATAGEVFIWLNISRASDRAICA